MGQETAMLGVMDYATFLNRTKPTISSFGIVSVLKSRGSNMHEIDVALQAWERACAKPDHDIKLQCLLGLQLACSRWLQRKRGKASNLCNFRRPAVQEVNVQARNAVQFLERKGADKGNPTKALHGKYALERQHYEALHKQSNPRSASAIGAEGLRTATINDFLTYDGDDAGRVQYHNRASRMAMLAYLEGGRFYHGNNLLSSTIGPLWGGRLECYVYAVDRHGNMFAREIIGQQLEGYFNHSSFCAGRQVLCAGTVAFWEGRLKYISNKSGHYQPTPENLQNYLVMLGQEGVDLAEVAVDAQSGPDTFHKCRATTFVANPRAPSDWPHYAQRTRTAANELAVYLGSNVNRTGRLIIIENPQ